MTLGIVGVENGISRAPFGDDIAERVVSAIGDVAVGISRCYAVAEHVVGVGLGCDVGGVRVGGCGEEVAARGVGEGLKRRERRFPDGGAYLNGLAARSTSCDHAGEGVVGVVGGFARCFSGERDTVEGTPDGGMNDDVAELLHYNDNLSTREIKYVYASRSNRLGVKVKRPSPFWAFSIPSVTICASKARRAVSHVKLCVSSALTKRMIPRDCRRAF